MTSHTLKNYFLSNLILATKKTANIYKNEKIVITNRKMWMAQNNCCQNEIIVNDTKLL